MWGLHAKLECILLHASVCSRLLKWLNQTTQVAQSASTADCVTRCSRILNPTQSYLQPDTIVTQRSLHMNSFYVIIYHPSRFACIIHLNMLIYRYLNSVIDTSKTEISLTLSITIWDYPSRFSHYTLPDTVSLQPCC